MKNIIANSFVLRHTSDSPFSHFEGSFDSIVEMVKSNFDNQRPGFRDGVILVKVPSDNFFSSVVKLAEGDELVGSFKARRDGEIPRKQVLAKGAQKVPAKKTEIVLFNSAALAEDGNNQLEASEDNWEIISINSSPCEGDEPINPMALMYNHFGGSGGTKTNMTAEKFEAAMRESFEFWSDKAMAG